MTVKTRLEYLAASWKCHWKPLVLSHHHLCHIFKNSLCLKVSYIIGLCVYESLWREGDQLFCEKQVISWWWSSGLNILHIFLQKRKKGLSSPNSFKAKRDDAFFSRHHKIGCTHMLVYRKPFVWFSKCQKFRLKWIVSPCWLFITELIWMDYIQDQLPPHVFLGAEFCYDALGPLKLFQHLIMIYYTRTGTGALWIFAFEHTLKVEFFGEGLHSFLWQ